MFIFIKTYVVSTVIAIFYLFHNGHTSNFNELSTLDELTRRLTPYSVERVIFGDYTVHDYLLLITLQHLDKLFEILKNHCVQYAFVVISSVKH